MLLQAYLCFGHIVTKVTFQVRSFSMDIFHVHSHIFLHIECPVTLGTLEGFVRILVAGQNMIF